jgi:IS5 family transposase
LDVESVAGHLIEPGSVFGFLAAHRARLFPPELFEDLFPSRRGRPSLAPEVVASVLVLQALNGLSDREAVEALRFDLRWKAACGLAVTDTGFDPSTLTYWRRRLAGSARPDRIFEVVAAVIAETGAVAGKTRRALDSTILDDAVARQDTVTQLIAAIRRVAREVPAAAEVVTGLGAEGRCAHDYSRPGKPEIAWDDPQARDELVSALVGDALAVLAGIEQAHPDGDGLTDTQSQAVALLALVAGQDVEPAEGSDGTDGRWRIARKVAPDRVISTVDPDTRHAHKSRERRQDGYKAHVVVEPDTGLITNTALTQASGPANSDAAVGIRLLEADPTVTAEQSLEVLGDSAYGTGQALAALDDAGHTPVIKPWPLRPAVEGGFTLDDFTLTDDGSPYGALTCPNGITRAIRANGAVSFKSACRGCPLRGRCTTAERGRELNLGTHHVLQRAHRARAATTEHLEPYRAHRPMVERSIAWLTRQARRVPYRGTVKNNAWLHLRVAAINLRRLLALGLHHHHNWALARS